MAYEHFYVYVCNPSSETRGSSAIAGKLATPKSTPCGRSNTHFTKQLINDDYRPQAAKCPECANRKRLNEGVVSKYDCFVQQKIRDGMGRVHTVDTDIIDLKASKDWAIKEAHRRNQSRKYHSLRRLSNPSEEVKKLLEQTVQSLEHMDEIIEQVGDLIE